MEYELADGKEPGPDVGTRSSWPVACPLGHCVPTCGLVSHFGGTAGPRRVRVRLANGFFPLRFYGAAARKGKCGSGLPPAARRVTAACARVRIWSGTRGDPVVTEDCTSQAKS